MTSTVVGWKILPKVIQMKMNYTEILVEYTGFRQGKWVSLSLGLHLQNEDKNLMTWKG